MNIFMMFLALLFGNGQGHGYGRANNPNKPPACPSEKPDTCEYPWPPKPHDPGPL